MLLRTRVRPALLPQAFLLAVGLIYFGQYYRHGFNYGDEGSLVLITARLMAGETPFVDIDLGYGLLWFYPVLLLFKITGVSFIAARVFFLALACTTALLARRVVQSHTRSRVLPLIISLAVLTVPGTLHKAYIPLIVIANMACVSSLDWNRQTLGRMEVFGWSLIAALSYHIRPDLGLCALVVLVATLTAHTLSRGPSWPRRAGKLGRLSLPILGGVLTPTVPLVLIAFRQGFLTPFLDTLIQPVRTVRALTLGLARALTETAQGLHAGASTLVAHPLPAALFGQGSSSPPEGIAQTGRTLARIPLAAALEHGPQQSLALLTYLPLLALVLITASVCWLMLTRKVGDESTIGVDTVGILAVLGLAYSAFPQFFSFRPDVPHLSQFMPGFLVLVGTYLGRWWCPPEAAARQEPRTSAGQSRHWRAARALIGAFLVLHVGFYSWFGLRHGHMGSIAIARGPSKRFQGVNGVDVLVTPASKDLLSTVVRVVETHTEEGDFMLCFPYCPGFNVITNRPTFAQRLYVDDSLAVMDPEWQDRMITRIEAERPSMVILDDWALNETEVSRFRNWATEVTEHIETKYEAAEIFGSFTFYVRRDRLDSTARAVPGD